MAPGNGDSVRVYPLRVSAWRDVPRLVHGFLGRAHALPSGGFSLGDLRACLSAAGEGPRVILAARQVHGSAVLTPEAALASFDDRARVRDLPNVLPEADALVSASSDVILTIRTADCVPILLVAPAAHAVAALHAGWRGLLGGVVANGVAALEERYGARPAAVRAAIGPAIGGCCYEFGADHLPRFVSRFGSAATRAWRADGSAAARGHLDLRLLAALALEQADLDPSAITTLGPCTAEHPDELHSYRRDGANAGRQLSYIGWRS